MTELDESDATGESVAPVWAVFGDLMSGLLGAFVLVLVGVLVMQMDLVANLQAEMEKRRIEEQRRMALGVDEKERVLRPRRRRRQQHERAQRPECPAQAPGSPGRGPAARPQR